jgi:purine-binding chemotaxis protein CheW
LIVDNLVVVFQLGSQCYGVDIAAVQEIRVASAVTPLPGAPDCVDGVINLRGRVVPVMDMHARFGQPRAERTKESRVIVVNVHGGEWVGLAVESVSEVLRVTADSVEVPSSLVKTADGDFIAGIAKVGDERLVTLLDLGALLAVATTPAYSPV